jgi:hypothetical protein
MEVKESVKTAINYVTEVFSDEKLSNIGLEEVTFDEEHQCWRVTIGFSRPWDYKKPSIVSGLEPQVPERQFKVVTVDDQNGKVCAIEIREQAR